MSHCNRLEARLRPYLDEWALLAGLSFLLLLSFETNALAYCEARPTVEQEFESSAFVLVGRITASKDLIDQEGFIAGTIYTFRTEERLKGKPVQTVELYSENSSGRFPMSPETSYLVFVALEVFEGFEAAQLAVSSCGNSGRVDETEKALRTARALSKAKAQASVAPEAPARR